MRKGYYPLITFSLIVLYLGYKMNQVYRDVTYGKEYPTKQTQEFLENNLRDTFGWSGLSDSSLDHNWSNGFKDHLSLYRIYITPEKYSSLRAAVLSKSGEGITLDDHDDLSVCPFDYATKSTESLLKLPTWWEVSSLKDFDGLLWHSLGSIYWFCYDRERLVLFLFTSNG